jgi:cyanophycin synthetase
MNPAPDHRPMRILEHGVYRGPHLYSHQPMVRLQVDLGDMESWPTDRLPGFAGALIGAIPTLESHGCCYGEPGGFLKRLREGTWMGHVVEHVALELQALAGARTTRGKTRSVKGRPGVYNVMFAYEDEETGLLAGRLAFQIVDALLPPERRGVVGLETLAGGPADLSGIETVEAALPLLKAARRRAMFGPSTQALVDAARRRGIPVTRLNGQSLVQLGWGARQRRLRASVTDRTGLVATELAGDNAEAKALLAAIGCPVARGVVVRTAEEAAAAAAGLKRPLVAKPLDGNHGRGVTTGLRSEADIVAAFAEAAKHSRRVIVEEELPRHRRGRTARPRSPDPRCRRAGGRGGGTRPGPGDRRRAPHDRGTGRGGQRRSSPRRRPREPAHPHPP